MKLNIKVQLGARTRDYVIDLPDGSDLRRADQGVLELRLNDKPLEVDWAEVSPGVFSLLMHGRSFLARVVKRTGQLAGNSGSHLVLVGNTQLHVEVQDPRRWRPATRALGPGRPQDIRAPMPGRIIRVLVEENQDVGADQGLLVIEAMKMQNELRAPRAGRVEKIHAREGVGVETGTLLIRLT